MTLPIQLAQSHSNAGAPSADGRAAKRIKVDAALSNVCQRDIEGDSTAVRRHPLGIRPAGNAFTSPVNLKNACGLFALLSDELITDLLELFGPEDLLRLGGTCRAFHAFTRNEELWRGLFVDLLARHLVDNAVLRLAGRSSPEHFTWQGTWKSTFLSQTSDREPQVDCSSLFSDVLHRPFFCAHVSLRSFTENIPDENQIARYGDLSHAQFSSEWAMRPFILTEPVKQWPIYKNWSTDHLLEKYANVNFRAESVDWPLHTYVEYMNNSRDESPLYLFDRAFAEKMDLTVSSDSDDGADYWPPTCFGHDLFSVLGAQRPDHRWLIVGPDRSGSTFHKDPNATSAWNAVLKGRKYWIMFKSSPAIPPPPGVYVSEDQSEVTSPLSIAEWLLGFHAEARQTPGCMEGICEEGEVLYVPSGWYHLVLNMEPSIAITQNLVPRGRLGAVLHFLKDQKQSISGFSNDVEDPYELFVQRLRESYPDVLEEGLAELDRLSKGGRGRWEELTKPASEDDADGGGGGGFSFGFGADDSDGDGNET